MNCRFSFLSLNAKGSDSALVTSVFPVSAVYLSCSRYLKKCFLDRVTITLAGHLLLQWSFGRFLGNEKTQSPTIVQGLLGYFLMLCTSGMLWSVSRSWWSHSWWSQHVVRFPVNIPSSPSCDACRISTSFLLAYSLVQTASSASATTHHLYAHHVSAIFCPVCPPDRQSQFMNEISFYKREFSPS